MLPGGQFVDLEELSERLQALPGMLSCAILGGERLEAFCTLEEELTIPLQRVQKEAQKICGPTARVHFRTQLPRHPVTGKVDRLQLQAQLDTLLQRELTYEEQKRWIQRQMLRAYCSCLPLCFYLVLPKWLGDELTWHLEKNFLRRRLKDLLIRFFIIPKIPWAASWAWEDHGRSFSILDSVGPVRVAKGNSGLSLAVEFSEEIQVPCARRAADVDEHASSASPSTAVGDGHGTLATLVARAGGDPSMLRLDSLQATVLAELIRKELHQSISVADVLRSQSLQEMQQRCEPCEEVNYEEEHGDLASHIKKCETFRVFLLQFPRHPVDWCLRVDAPIDLHAFQRAVDRCVAQHSALRTSETPDEALRDTMDKAAALWQLWRAVGRRSDCWERVMASALFALWPRTRVARSEEAPRLEVRVPPLVDGRVRDPRWDWASHDQYIHSVFDDLLKPRRWPFDVAVAPLFHGTAAGHSAIEAALSKPASEVAWYIYCSITHAYSDGLSGQALFADLLRFYHEERETQGGPSSAAKEELGPTPEPLALLQRRLWRSLCKPGNLPEPNDDLYHESICDDWGRRAGQSRRIYFHPNVTRTLRLAARHCFGCSVDLAWLTAIMCTMFRLFPQQPRMLLILKASCRDGPGQGQMVGFLSEARLIAVDAGDLATANIWEVHKLIDSARLARDWRAPEPFEFGLCVYVNIVSAMVDSLPPGYRHLVREAAPPSRWYSTAYSHLNLRTGPSFSRRIGHYFAALVEFWLRWCPVLNATKVLARQQVTAEEPAPERPGQEDYTTNQLKFLARLEGDEALHLEAAFHFSLARGPREKVVANSPMQGFLHESLCWRILEARIRARLAAEASVKKQLQEWLGASPSFQFLLRGRVFFEERARNPVLVSEVQRQANGRWEEVSKGFVLPRKWSMAPESATAMRSSDLKAETSITRLQRSMEQVLQAEGIDAWWCQVERLELAAEDTERRSAEERKPQRPAQERRASALWQPPKAREALPKAGLVEALESRWASTNEDELCDTRAAVLCHLAETADLTQTLIDLLLEIFQRCRQPRALGHVVLDAAQRLLRRRDKVFYDRPLTRGASAKWQQLIERAASGMFCPKVVAKASKQLGMEAVATKGRQESVADLLARFEDFNFPDRPIESTHREATLTGAVQLCTLRLQQLQRQREARRCREDGTGSTEPQVTRKPHAASFEETEDSEDQAETGGCCLGGFACDSNCCLAVCRCEARCCCRCRCDLLLRVDEVQPLFLWCASHGELAPAKALAQTESRSHPKIHGEGFLTQELCGAIAQSLEADLAALLQASGVSLGRRQRRRVNEPKAAAAAPTPATAKERSTNADGAASTRSPADVGFWTCELCSGQPCKPFCASFVPKGSLWAMAFRVICCGFVISVDT
eukprot:g12304.t1